MQPTLICNLEIDDVFDQTEHFAPVASLRIFDNIQDAISLANSSVYGLTSAVHTESINTAALFESKLDHGVVNINCGTFGSEPHFPFGGFGESGNGSREPGTEALNVYSQLKVISVLQVSGD